jgi:hypothetical protein
MHHVSYHRAMDPPKNDMVQFSYKYKNQHPRRTTKRQQNNNQERQGQLFIEAEDINDSSVSCLYPRMKTTTLTKIMTTFDKNYDADSNDETNRGRQR